MIGPDIGSTISLDCSSHVITAESKQILLVFFNRLQRLPLSLQAPHPRTPPTETLNRTILIRVLNDLKFRSNETFSWGCTCLNVRT